MELTIYLVGLLALLFGSSIFGGFPERAVTVIILIVDVADRLYHQFYGPSDFTQIDYVHLAIDTLAFLAVLWIALGANRFWPLPVCSLHLIGITGHVAILSGVKGINQVYWAMLNVTDYMQVPIVFIGIIAHARRRRRIGRYRDWRRDWRVPAFLSSPLPGPKTA